jgi:hypothetical protein
VSALDEEGGTAEAVKAGTAVIPVEKAEKAEELLSVTEHFLTHWKISGVFEERPDVRKKLEAFDMNSWQDIRVDKESGAPDFMEHQQGKYVIYQICTQIPKEINGHLPLLHFHALWGECEIYFNGEKRGECNYEWPCEFTLELNHEDIGEAEIRVLVRSRNINAGLSSLVVLR